MGKTNILYVISKLELGGAQKHLLSIIANLDKSKFNIFLFTAKGGLILNDALAISALCTKTSSFLERKINIFKDFAALFEIYGFIKKIILILSIPIALKPVLSDVWPQD